MPKYPLKTQNWYIETLQLPIYSEHDSSNRKVFPPKKVFTVNEFRKKNDSLFSPHQLSPITYWTGILYECNIVLYSQVKEFMLPHVLQQVYQQFYICAAISTSFFPCRLQRHLIGLENVCIMCASSYESRLTLHLCHLSIIKITNVIYHDYAVSCRLWRLISIDSSVNVVYRVCACIWHCMYIHMYVVRSRFAHALWCICTVHFVLINGNNFWFWKLYNGNCL